ncbi:MAG TPA: hypothetical protein DCZ03_02100, partial [Gammaproteobacteria bacterium]|nr:hypothetical protein [Gammaproteobacteria bacterium]
ETLLADTHCPIEAISLVDEPELFSILNVSPRDVTHIYPLTSHQRDMYLGMLHDPDTLNNSMGCYTRMSFRVDEDLWKLAIQQIQKEHGVLSSTLIESNVPYANLVYRLEHNSVETNLEYVDFSNQRLSTEQQDSWLREC